MTFAPISQERWDAVWAADLDVLRSLGESGDRPEIEREVDVSFRGDLAALQLLARASGNFGFTVRELLDADEDGQPWLFLIRDQAMTEDALRELTETYLQIEDTFSVECDGWGCVAQAS